MKSILEYLSKSTVEQKEKNPDDPTTWSFGDIICGTAGWSMCLPRWFKIIKKTAKQFTCRRLKGKIVSGHHNGQWTEIPSNEYYDEKEYKGRITKWGGLRIDDTLMHLWDGKTPLHGDDMD